MKIWKISQTINNEYDTYDSAVVAAETEEEAKTIHPSNEEAMLPAIKEEDAEEDYNDYYKYRDWVRDTTDVRAIEIGLAHSSIKPREVICTSFNAG